MPTPPAKRRKNETNSPIIKSPRGVEYYFKKAKDNDNVNEESETSLTDEQLARKLQDEYDKQEEQDRNLIGEPITSAGDDGAQFFANNEEVSPGEDPIEAKKEESSVLPAELGNKTSSATTAVEVEIPFDKDPFLFDPEAFADVANHWPDGKAPYLVLGHTFVLVNSTRSRIKIVDYLANMLRLLIVLDPKSLLPAVWLTTNDIAPSYENIEMGIGGSVLTKALKNVSGMSNSGLKTLYNKYGDPGDVAFEAKVSVRTLAQPPPLSIQSVYNSLWKIATAKGGGSQEVKQKIAERLLVAGKGEEIRYLVRTLVRHLRIGAVKTTMLIALAKAFTLNRPRSAVWTLPDFGATEKDRKHDYFTYAEEVLKQCFARRPNYTDIVPALLNGGIEGLREVTLTLGVPLRPMLGSITRDLTEMFTKLQSRDFTCEYKYDGQRAQVHVDRNGKVSIFSRHLELMTEKYPDLVKLMPTIRGDGVESFILEGEVVAVDRESGNLKAFQTLSNRGRKDVALSNIKVDVCLFAFDLMLLNDEPLLNRSLRERRDLLRSMFKEIKGCFTWVASLDATSADQESVMSFFQDALSIKCEGIMVKVLDNSGDLEVEEKVPVTDKEKGGRRKALLATYEPDKRLESWLKVKKDYDSAADSLDLVPIAGWHGQGRKAQWWSPYLLAVRNSETGDLDAVCKCISGFTDAFYKEMKEKYAEGSLNTTPEEGDFVNCTLHPDCFFKPQGKLPIKFRWANWVEVWEIRFGDITQSPVYTAAIGLISEDRGLSLRFPRFVRKREDKGIEEASTDEELADMYRKQVSSGAKAPTEIVQEGIDDDGLYAE